MTKVGSGIHEMQIAHFRAEYDKQQLPALLRTTYNQWILDKNEAWPENCHSKHRRRSTGRRPCAGGNLGRLQSRLAHTPPTGAN